MSTLQLGADHRPLDDAINHDRWQHSPWIDIGHDLDITPWPWDDASFDKVVALDVMEHLKVDVQVWLDECWRILKPGGTLVLRLPQYSNPVSYRDPTHRRVYHHESFHYWDRRTQLWHDYGQFYFGPGYNKWWTVVSVDRNTNGGDLGVVMTKVDA